MYHYVLYGAERYGPYDDWADAYYFAVINFGFRGWSIYTDE